MSSRQLFGRALAALALHLGLLALFPLVRPLYAPVFRALAELSVAAIDPLPGPIEVAFEPGAGGVLAANVPGMDTVVSLRHRELAGPDATFGASSFFHAWIPSSVLLAVTLVTPRSARTRRGRIALAWVLLHAFFALRCALATLYCASKCNVDGVPVVPLGPNAARALHLGWHFAFGEDFANYLVPLVLWALLVFGPRSSASNGP
jgi:hypothetical protein